MGTYRSCKPGSWKRVRSKYGGTVMRCGDFVVHRRGRRKAKKLYRKRSRRTPFNKGKKCVDMRAHLVKGKMQAFCYSWGANPKWREKKRRKGPKEPGRGWRNYFGNKAAGESYGNVYRRKMSAAGVGRRRVENIPGGLYSGYGSGWWG